MLAGGAPGRRGPPGVQSDAGLPMGEDDAPKLLCAPNRLAPGGSGFETGAGTGAGGKAVAVAPGGEKTLLSDCRGVKSRRRENGPGPAVRGTGKSRAASGEEA